MSEDIVRRYFEACTSGSAADIAACFADDAVVFDINHPPVEGAETIGSFWEKIREKWVGAEWLVDTYVGDDRAGAIEWTMRGRDGDRRFMIRGSEHYEFDDGRIRQIRQYWTFDPAAPGSALHGYPYESDGRFAHGP